MTGGASSDSLSLIVHSGGYDRVHYALVLAAAAAAVGRPVIVFFAGDAIRALMGPASDGRPGWSRLAGDAESRDSQLSDRGVATFEALLSACGEMNVRFMVCEMALRAAAVPENHLRTDVTFEVAGAVTFLTEAPPGGTTLFI
ncbi:MAG: DsrE family protein [Hyphomicrobiales bacterium]|nr:DsrE family protein [Hyphomicrobiales bacterium]